MKTNQEFKNEALASLKGNWPAAVVSTLVMVLIGGSVSGVSCGTETYPVLTLPFFLFSIFVVLPIGVGFNMAYRKLLAEGDTDILGNMFRIGFSSRYLKIVCTMLLVNIYVFLWTLLFIVPGIIKTFSYAMTPYILVEEPELTANQAIDKSRAMMKGHKFDLFWLYLSFIGWGILCILTVGIGFLWLVPYIEASSSAFYAEVKAAYESGQTA